MIVSFALEFQDEKEMRAVAQRLWNRHKITGEMEMMPIGDGRWRLSVHSEKQLRQSTIDKLPGKPVAVKGAR